MKQAKDWSHLYPRYAGKWVAFAKDEETVMGSARTFKTAIKEAQSKGIKTPLMFKVPEEMLPYVGST